MWLWLCCVSSVSCRLRTTDPSLCGMTALAQSKSFRKDTGERISKYRQPGNLRVTEQAFQTLVFLLGNKRWFNKYLNKERIRSEIALSDPTTCVPGKCPLHTCCPGSIMNGTPSTLRSISPWVINHADTLPRSETGGWEDKADPYEIQNFFTATVIYQNGPESCQYCTDSLWIKSCTENSVYFH